MAFQLNDAGEKLIIRMINCVWKDEQMQRNPTYYREGQGWIEAMLEFKILIDHNQHPVVCITDHTPLSWIKSTSGKGAVGEFLLNSMDWLDFVIEWKEGKSMHGSDGLSRYPMLGPLQLRSQGLRTALVDLLATLTDTPNNLRNIWFHAQKDSEVLKPLVEEWRVKMLKPELLLKALTVKISTPNLINVHKREYDLAIWLPFSDKITHTCAAALNKDKSFAILMPSVLIPRIGQLADGTYCPLIQSKVALCKKIVLLSSELTWLLYKLPTCKSRVMINRMWTLENLFDKQEKEFPVESYRGIIPRPFKVDHQEWIKEQQGTKEEYATANLSVTRREDGILTYCPNLNLQLIIVPPEKRKLLTTYCHEMKCHVQHSKIYSHMAKTYH